MTFLEVLTLIGERGEKVISDRSHAIQTEKRLYARMANGDWEEREPPPALADRFPPLPESKKDSK